MMNKWLFIILLAPAMLASNPFETANKMYREDKFPEAIKAYEEILKTGVESAEIYFNLGNSYYKLNKVGPAVYNFEKALRLNPSDRDTKVNLHFAQKMMIDEAKEPSPAGFGQMLGGFTNQLHFDAWAWVAVFLGVSVFVFFVLYYFAARAMAKRIYFFTMLLQFVLMLLAIGAAWYEHDRFVNERPAIVFDGVAVVKAEPKNGSSDVGVLHEGSKVYVLESLDNWNKVLLPDGNDGWISKQAIRELKH
jgi:tetratricopeptide (TPR) repeat protein